MAVCSAPSPTPPRATTSTGCRITAGSCAYDGKKRSEADACPSHALYWDLLDRNRVKLEGNPRVAQICRCWDRMKDAARVATLARARDLLERLDRGERV
jgi:deoxyribodipyrimidine photolyase-like uncharacterized protein